jgi:cytochrome c oxidase assembly protein subunit 15
MVKSGLDEELFTTPGAVPRVSQYRLAAHLGAALVLYTGMVHTANTIKRDWKYAMGGENVKIAGVTGADRLRVLLDSPAVRRFGKWSTFVGGMVLFTAISGNLSDFSAMFYHAGAQLTRPPWSRRCLCGRS